MRRAGTCIHISWDGQNKKEDSLKNTVKKNAVWKPNIFKWTKHHPEFKDVFLNNV